MSKVDFKNNDNLWNKIALSSFFTVIRNSLSLTLPVVITGAFAVLINNFPVVQYQNFMLDFFGPTWKSFGAHIWNGTLAVMSIIMSFTIGQNIGNNYDIKNKLDNLHPAVVGLISFCSLMVVMESLQEAHKWVGIHGLFLALIVSTLASYLFLIFYRIKALQITFFSEEANKTIIGAFNALIPGILTITVFALLKIFTTTIGIDNIHELVYGFIYKPFEGMGNTLTTALLYNLVRHILWFTGIHGSNALEPVMTEIYKKAEIANSVAYAAGDEIPHVFTKTFFDIYISLGGSGSTLCLIAACFIFSNRGSIRRIAQISLLPALFNINETILFGLPIVLNPIFLIPFVVTPLLLTITSYVAISIGIVPHTIQEVAWTTPAIISGYVATGSIAGSILQIINLCIGVAIYIPFVKIAERNNHRKFEYNFNQLLNIAINDSKEEYSLLKRQDEAGSLARSLANELLKSINKNQLYLEYQPQVDCRTGKIIGVEALTRWNHPSIGNIPPSLFIAIAEDTGFIDDMGLWICELAVEQQKKWIEQGYNVVVSVNVSVKQLEDKDFSKKFINIIEKKGVPFESMKIEVTESAGIIADLGHNYMLQMLRDKGIEIAIDDFGMGHSSLVYLKHFPVKTIKLDGSLVKDITRNRISMEIVSTISELCRSMDIDLLAEFVEDEEQAKVLKSLNCYYFQGWFYSKSVSPDECTKLFSKKFQVI